MRKQLIGLMFVLFALGASAKTWTNNVGVGITVPLSYIGVDDADDDIAQIGLGLFDAIYLGYHENGFAVKAALSAGLAFSDGITLHGSDADFGVFYHGTAGIGYAFVRTEKLVVSATGTLGAEFAAYADSYTLPDEKADDLTDGFGFAMVSVGADVTALYRLKEHFGVYANLSVRYPIWGRGIDVTIARYSLAGKDHTDVTSFAGDLFGKCLVQPSLGVVWNF